MMLSNKEATALKEFRHRISDVITRVDEFQRNDKNLLRWLKAREFNVAKSEQMFRKALEWREENDVDKILTRQLPNYFFKDLPHQAVGHDKEGCVICAIPLGKWDLKKTMEMGYRDLFHQYVVQILERGMAYCKKNHAKNPKSASQFVLIFDFEGFSLTQVMSQAAVGAMIECLRFFEANYPEMMKAGFAVNAPKVFEILWAMLKPVMAQRTLSKCQIFGSNTAQWRGALADMIDRHELPSQFGGSNTTHPFYIPEHRMDWPARAAEFPDEELTTVTVPAGEKFTRSFYIQPGQNFSWNFKTDMNDIGFQVEQDGSPMYPFAKCDAHICTQDGIVQVKTAGTYTLVFDNSHSRFRSKTLHYAVRIEKS